MAGHNAVGTPSGARRCSADGRIALGLQSQTSVRQAARVCAFSDLCFCSAPAWARVLGLARSPNRSILGKRLSYKALTRRCLGESRLKPERSETITLVALHAV